MADRAQSSSTGDSMAIDKGKGKALEHHDDMMDEDDDDDEDEEDEVGSFFAAQST